MLSERRKTPESHSESRFCYAEYMFGAVFFTKRNDVCDFGSRSRSFLSLGCSMYGPPGRPTEARREV